MNLPDGALIDMKDEKNDELPNRAQQRETHTKGPPRGKSRRSQNHHPQELSLKTARKEKTGQRTFKPPAGE